MDYVAFGNTGIKVSQLCYGTMSFGGDADEVESGRLYAACRDAGINFFDTANVYSQGRSEEILGKLIKGERDNLIISTKGFGQMGGDINAKGSSRRNIALAIEQSLKRLGTDRVDVYFMHMWDPATPLEETLRALEKLVADGKVLYIGASNYAAWQIAKGLGISAKHDWPRFDVLQPMYNLVKRQAETEILPLAAAEKLAVMPYSPVGGGLLSGKYVGGAKPEGTRLTAMDMYAKRYGEDWVHQTAADYTAFCRERGLHPVSAAVAWVMRHPAITCPIIGARNVDQLKASLDAVDVPMDADLRAELAALSREPAIATDRREEAL
ncbi:MAG: aldo/keto reductase [Hyphomicrobiaceae bacterium]|nr:aldo/keto reductase [Hyphomicrobiaceae bacterium]MCC0024341.1 aldo/keto reductase [Hyphomicrobiaceae bacterium]